MQIDFISVMFIIVAIGAVFLFAILPRYGPHYTSRLTCPACKKAFNLHWIPGATLISIIRPSKRQIKCPYCHRKATYDILVTRVRSAKTQKLE